MALDPYATLGVSKTATEDEIKSAYRKLARQFHPDLNPGNKEAERKFKDIAAAYELVGTKEAREKYERGEAEAEAARQWYGRGQGGGRHGRPFYYETHTDPNGRYSYSFTDRGTGGQEGAEDLFESIFGGARGAGARARARGPQPGQDELYRMNVSFRDAALGAEREITLPSGKKLRVKIPGGVASGQRLRFIGQGGPGTEGGPAGDVYVELEVEPLEGFNRVGNDLETELPISLAEAVLGGEVPVRTIDGAVKMRVPKGVSSGARLRLRNKGVANGPGGTRGDQYVVLRIVLPEKIDPELESAIRSWSEKHPHDPRQGRSGGGQSAA